MPKDINKLVYENMILKNDYSSYHDTWKEQAKLNRDYVFNKQWTEDEVSALNERGQAPTCVNRIQPVVEQKLAIMAARDPNIRCLARDDSDVKVSKMLQQIMQYVWYISDGTMKYRQALSDCVITGLGFMYVYLDKYADDGLGEIKFAYAHGEDIYVDPNAKDPLFSDAENILIIKYVTREQLKMLFPDKESLIDSCVGTAESTTTSNMVSSDGQIVLGDVNESIAEKVELIERYQKIRVKYTKYSYIDPADNQVKENVVKASDLNKIVSSGIVPLNSINIFKTRVRVICTAGEKLLYEYVMPISEYPIVPFTNIYTGSPYSMGDPAFLIGIQDIINKMYSLMIAHATTSTSPKVLLPEGSVKDKDEMEREWSKPGSVIEYFPESGPPVPVPPVPLPNALYTLAQDGKYEIEYGSGIFSVMQGSSADAPDTFRGTLAIEEFGNRRITYRMKAIEASLTRLFQVALEYAQYHYTIEKTFRIVQPNGITEDTHVNIPMYDDYGQILERVNDITAGKYDVIVVAGSTMPSNRWAEAEEYKQWYQMGLIDDVEVLKKLDIFDREGLLERKSQIGQMMSQNKQLVSTVEQLSKELETLRKKQTDHEKELELTEYKAKIDAYLDRLKNSTKLYDSMLKNKTKTLEKELSLDMKDTLRTAQASSKKGD